MNRERKYIIIAGIILLIAGALYRFMPEFQEMQLWALDEEIRVKKQRILRYQHIVQERDSLEKNLITLNRTLDSEESAALDGETVNVAAANLQSMLKDILNRQKLEIGDSRVITPATPEQENAENPYQNISVQISMKTNIRQLKDILYEIEMSHKLLNIVDLRIRIAGTKQEEIHSTLTVQGVMKKKSGQLSVVSYQKATELASYTSNTSLTTYVH